jgi:nitrate reductase delta subunit
MIAGNIHDALAALLTYPAEDYGAHIEAAVRAAPAACASYLSAFAAQVRPFTTAQMQELFTVTFDLNPVCSLELGWHLFGENYDRGLLLVRMRQELRRYTVAESSELPDHLTHALRLLGRMEADRGEDFAAACVLPALEKMLAAMRGKGSAYEHVLEAVRHLLHAQFPGMPLVEPKGTPLHVLPQEVV